MIWLVNLLNTLLCIPRHFSRIRFMGAIVTMACFTGCGGETGSGDKLLLSDVHFSDPVLQECVTSMELTYVSELTSLICSGTYEKGSVSDAMGIEALTALESLEIHFSSLSKLDLSQNSALKRLTILLNTQAVDVHLPNAGNLEFLRLQQAKASLTNLSKQEILKTLNVSKGDFPVVDLSQNVHLEKLVLREVEAETLILPQSNTITELDLYGNRLASIDLDALGAVTGINLHNNPLPCAFAEAVRARFPFAGIDSDAVLVCGIYLEFPDQNLASCVDRTDLPLEEITKLSCASLETLENVGKMTSLRTVDFDFTDETNAVDLSPLPMLTKAVISGDGIAELNLTKNTLLEEIDIAFTKLKSLDLSNNTRLEIIETAFNFDLVDLTLPASVFLTNLSVRSSRLESLDVSKNPRIKHLELSSLNLAHLDLSHNPDLVTVSVSHLPLTELDLSANFGVERLYVVDSELSTLNLSQPSSIKRLEVIGTDLAYVDLSGSTELRSVILENNQLDDLVLPNSSFLSHVDVENNRISSLLLPRGAPIETLKASGNALRLLNLENFPDLRLLEVSNNQLSELNVESNKKLRNLAVDSNNLHTIELANLGVLGSLNVSNNPLRKLDLSTNIGLERLSAANSELSTIDLSTNIQLDSLDLAFNHFSRIDLSQLKSLQYLNLDANELETIVWPTTAGLSSVSVAYNRLTSLDTHYLDHLEVIRIQGNYFSCTEVDRLESELTSFRNYVSPSCFTVIPSNFNQISLSDIRFADENLGACILGSGKASTEELTKLECMDMSVAYLTDLAYFPSLEYLDLSFNKLILRPPSSSSAVLEAPFYRNKNLTNLILNYAGLYDLFLPNLDDLSTLSLANNRFQELVLKNLTSLSDLDISGNENLCDGLDAIKAQIPHARVVEPECDL